MHEDAGDEDDEDGDCEDMDMEETPDISAQFNGYSLKTNGNDLKTIKGGMNSMGTTTT